MVKPISSVIIVVVATLFAIPSVTGYAYSYDANYPSEEWFMNSYQRGRPNDPDYCRNKCKQKSGKYAYECQYGRDYRCRCTKCQRQCDLNEIDHDINHCNEAQKSIETRTNGIGGQVQDVMEDVAVSAISNFLPVIGGGLEGALGMSRAVGDDHNALLNGVIDDMNGRMDHMYKCIGQQVARVEANSLVDSMQEAYNLYDIAASHIGDNNSKKERLHDAWVKHALVADTQFDNVDKSKDYFKPLLLQMQDFATSFLFVSVDYLSYLHVLDENNYKQFFDRTISSFAMLARWTRKAEDVISADMLSRIRTLPCHNGDILDGQRSAWKTDFHQINTEPIEKFAGWIHKLNGVLDGRARYIGCYGDASSRAMRNGPKQRGWWWWKTEYGWTGSSCSAACNGYTYFALQNGGQCFCENDWNHAKKYGTSNSCRSDKMGGAWANDIFKNSKANAAKTVSKFVGNYGLANEDLMILCLVLFNIGTILGCISCLYLIKQRGAPSKGYVSVEPQNADEEELIIEDVKA